MKGHTDGLPAMLCVFPVLDGDSVGVDQLEHHERTAVGLRIYQVLASIQPPICEAQGERKKLYSRHNARPRLLYNIGFTIFTPFTGWLLPTFVTVIALPAVV